MHSTLFNSYTLLLASLLVVPAVRGVDYALTDNWEGSSFLNEFTWEAIADPTNGRVNYLDQATSLSLNLTYASDTSL
jgi:hypothetical protein